MIKKVIDIIPKKEIKKEEFFPVVEEKTEKEEDFSFKKEEFSLKPEKPKRLFSSGQKIFIFTFVFLIFTFVLAYFNLSKAEILIWPETEKLILDSNLTVDLAAEGVDVSAKVIPGKLIEKEKIFTDNFTPTGESEEEGKAEGIIRVYNEYSTASQVLIATTRFMSSEGKLFRTPTKVIVPGATYEGGKLVAGEIDIKVIADESGSEYNIGPTTFSIPGFAGTARYTKFYAKSFEPMTGGTLNKTFQVTKEDLENAEKTLTEKAEQESSIFLKDYLGFEGFSSEHSYLDEAVQTEIIESFSLTQPGEEVDNFSFQVKAKSKNIVFKTEDFKNFSKEIIYSQIEEEKEIYEESLEVDYVLENVDFNSGKATLSLKISAIIYPAVNENNLKNGLSGKTLEESQLFLNDQPKIVKAEVKFWPFWVNSVPRDLNKIKLRLEFTP